MSEQVVAAPAAEAALSQESASQETNESLESQEVEGSEEQIEESESEEVEAKGEEKDKSDKKTKSKEEKALEKRIKKLKLKVDGHELEEEIDLDDEERLVRELQLARMGQKRAKEKADLENELRTFFEQLQNDPMELLAREFKMNPEQLIESYINKQLENAKKTPEQIEKERLETELKAIREEREREKQEAQQRELERLQQQEFERYDMLMDQALSKSDLPKNPYVVKKIADYMLVGLEAGMDVTPEDVIPLVRDEMHADLKEMFKVLPVESIEALLGDQVINNLRKKRVAKAQEAQKKVAKPQIADSGKAVTQDDGKSKEKISYKDFFKI